MAHFTESRDLKGNLNYLLGEKKLNEIKDCKLTDLENNQEKKIREIYNFDK